MDRDQAVQFMHNLLRAMLSKKASDLFITAGFPPAMDFGCHRHAFCSYLRSTSYGTVHRLSGTSH